MTEKTIVFRLNDAARVETNKGKKDGFKFLAVIVDTYLKRVYTNPTNENMRLANGVWAAAEAALKSATPTAPPAAPLAPAGRTGAMLAAAAALLVCVLAGQPAEAGHRGRQSHGLQHKHSAGNTSVFCDRRTATGTMDCGRFVFAHRTLPLNTLHHIVCMPYRILAKVVDRGPFVRGRTIDLSPAAAAALRVHGLGNCSVED